MNESEANLVGANRRLLLYPVALRYVIAGVVLGVALLHPLMEAVYWFGSHDRLVSATGSLGRAIARRLILAFTPGMLPMTGLFAAISATIGLGFGLHASRLVGSRGATLAS